VVGGDGVVGVDEAWEPIEMFPRKRNRGSDESSLNLCWQFYSDPRFIRDPERCQDIGKKHEMTKGQRMKDMSDDSTYLDLWMIRSDAIPY